MRMLFDVAMRTAMAGLSPAGTSARLSIAIFHRVVQRPDELFPDEPDLAAFDEICGWLKTWFQVMPLDQAVCRMQEGTLPSRALAITFDDGYEDNHSVALPVLRAHGLTATFFVATGFLDGGRMWNDTVIEAVRRCERHTLDLRGMALPGAQVWDVSSPAAKRAAIDALLPMVKYLESPARLAYVTEIAERAGAPLPDDLMMSSEQVLDLARQGMQIGAHTVNHPILAGAGDEVAWGEVSGSKAQLEGLLGRSVELFAYPNGRPGQDFVERDAELVRRAGFTAAVTTASGAARQGDDCFRLPRFTPWARTRTRFGAQLARNVFKARRAE